MWHLFCSPAATWDPSPAMDRFFQIATSFLNRSIGLKHPFPTTRPVLKLSLTLTLTLHCRVGPGPTLCGPGDLYYPPGPHCHMGLPIHVETPTASTCPAYFVVIIPPQGQGSSHEDHPRVYGGWPSLPGNSNLRSTGKAGEVLRTTLTQGQNWNSRQSQRKALP